jgi:hypothetical protein
MAGHLLLVNPSGGKKRRKTAARKRPRRHKMSALQRKYFGKRGHGRTINPSRHKRRRRHAVAANPVRRYRRQNTIARHRRRRINPVRSRRHRVASLTSTLTGAALGTVGALATDVAFGFLPIPAQFKTGAMGTLAKGAVTIGLGMLAAKAVGRNIAEKATSGALTVQLYNFAKPIVAAAAPNIPGLGYYGAGYALNGMGEYISDIPSSLNAFVPNSLMGDDDDTRNYPGEDLSMYLPMR